MSFTCIPGSISAHPPPIPLPLTSTPFPFGSVTLEAKNPVVSYYTIPPNNPRVQEFSHNLLSSASQHPDGPGDQFYKVLKALEDRTILCNIPLVAIGSLISPFISKCQEPRILSLETMPVPNEPNTIGLGSSSTSHRDAFASDVFPRNRRLRAGSRLGTSSTPGLELDLISPDSSPGEVVGHWRISLDYRVMFSMDDNPILPIPCTRSGSNRGDGAHAIANGFGFGLGHGRPWSDIRRWDGRGRNEGCKRVWNWREASGFCALSQRSQLESSSCPHSRRDPDDKEEGEARRVFKQPLRKSGGHVRMGSTTSSILMAPFVQPYDIDSDLPVCPLCIQIRSFLFPCYCRSLRPRPSMRWTSLKHTTVQDDFS